MRTLSARTLVSPLKSIKIECKRVFSVGFDCECRLTEDVLSNKTVTEKNGNKRTYMQTFRDVCSKIQKKQSVVQENRKSVSKYKTVDLEEDLQVFQEHLNREPLEIIVIEDDLDSPPGSVGINSSLEEQLLQSERSYNENLQGISSSTREDNNNDVVDEGLMLNASFVDDIVREQEISDKSDDDINLNDSKEVKKCSNSIFEQTFVDDDLILNEQTNCLNDAECYEIENEQVDNDSFEYVPDEVNELDKTIQLSPEIRIANEDHIWDLEMSYVSIEKQH